MSGMTENSTIDLDELLWELNDEKARLFTPVFIYIGILMFLGITGNAMVLYFYGYKNKISPSTCFILALAVYDLISCIVAMPMEIADLRFYFNFKNLAACRILRLVSHFASISSGLTLVVIAIDRYKRICRPFDRQLNNGHVKIMCAVIGIVSAILSWPAILFNIIVDVDVPNANNVTLTGHDCTTTKDEEFKIYILITDIVYVTAFSVITFVLGILYSLVGRQLFRHKKFRRYVAKKGTTSARAMSTSPLLPVSSDDDRNTTEETTPSNRVFEDPPDATGSVVDLKEFVTRGLTQIESDRPTSGYTGLTRSTGLTLSTGISGTRTKRSMQSIKSVKICEPSQNQIISIEARGDCQENGALAKDDIRATSPSSFATFSSRPSSADMSEYSESDTVQGNEAEIEGKFRVPKETSRLSVVDEYRQMLADREREESEVIDKEVDADHSNDNITANSTCVGDLSTLGDNVISVELAHAIGVSQNPEVLDKTEDCISTDTNRKEIGKTTNRRRPSSKSSDNSRRSRFRRTNTVSPESSIVTTTTSIASRASTVRRFQSFLRYNSKSSKMETDTDKVKDLRMKMLDLNTMKYTVIMAIITFVFVVSFLPYLSLVSWRYFKDEHEVNILTDLELVLFQIGIRSVFLNSSINPIIYGGFNSNFRAFFYGLCCKCCKNKRKRTRKQKARDQSDSTSG